MRHHGEDVIMRGYMILNFNKYNVMTEKQARKQWDDHVSGILGIPDFRKLINEMKRRAMLKENARAWMRVLPDVLHQKALKNTNIEQADKN